MANPVVSLVGYVPATKGVGGGQLIVDLTWTTYAQNTDVIDLTNNNGVAGTDLRKILPNFNPTDVKEFQGQIPDTGGWISGAAAATPTWANLGIARVWYGASQQVAGAYAGVARTVLNLVRPLPF